MPMLMRRDLVMICFSLFFMGISLRSYSRLKSTHDFAGMSKVKEAGSMTDWLMLIVSFLVFIYLGITLVLPEKF